MTPMDAAPFDSSGEDALRDRVRHLEVTLPHAEESPILAIETLPKCKQIVVS